MKTGEGHAVTDLNDGSIDATMTVTKLEDGYVMFQIARCARNGESSVAARITITVDQAEDFATKVKEAAKK